MDGKRLNKLESCNTLISPQSYVIGERKEFDQLSETTVYKHKPVFVEFIPIGKVFKVVLSRYLTQKFLA